MKIASGAYECTNYALATVLGTLGFGWQDSAHPCTNYYKNGNRPERRGDGRLGRLGKVTFHISPKSGEYPELALGKVEDVFDGKGRPPGQELDVEIDSIMDAGVRERLKELLPLAYAECARNTLANLKARKDAPHKVAALIEVETDNGIAIVSENISKEYQDEWGIAV